MSSSGSNQLFDSMRMRIDQLETKVKECEKAKKDLDDHIKECNDQSKKQEKDRDDLIKRVGDLKKKIEDMTSASTSKRKKPNIEEIPRSNLFRETPVILQRSLGHYTKISDLKPDIEGQITKVHVETKSQNYLTISGRKTLTLKLIDKSSNSYINAFIPENLYEKFDQTIQVDREYIIKNFDVKKFKETKKKPDFDILLDEKTDINLNEDGYFNKSIFTNASLENCKNLDVCTIETLNEKMENNEQWKIEVKIQEIKVKYIQKRDEIITSLYMEIEHNEFKIIAKSSSKEFIEKLNKKFKKYKSYIITECKLFKPFHKQQSDCYIMLTNDSILSILINPILISEIAFKKKGDTVTVLGRSTESVRQDDDPPRSYFTLHDKSSEEFTVTLWKELFEKVTIENNQVVLLIQVKVGDLRGAKLLSVHELSSIIVNPKISDDDINEWIGHAEVITIDDDNSTQD
uniref:Replication protein A 70 kDa DNA-binding subunit B/D first OB fold domain-containing protein n=1 Tax=Glossina brevipalpis TaxID=37001 RepID=A0A1A9WJ78_9MUSC